MKAIPLLLIYAILAWTPMTLSMEPPSAGLDTLEDLVRQWMELRTAMATDQREWTERRGQWERETELLEREAQRLDLEIAADNRRLESFEQEKAGLSARRQVLMADGKELQAVFGRAEAALKHWESSIPPGLRTSRQDVFRKLPSGCDHAADLPLSVRAQTIVALYTLIENLHHGVHAGREMVTMEDGTRRQVEALYLGMARAWAVSPHDDWAATGVPAGEGWQWQSAAEYAGAIRRALEVYHRARTAQWIDLPMGIAGEEQP